MWGSGSPHCAALDAADAAWTMTAEGAIAPSGHCPAVSPALQSS